MAGGQLLLVRAVVVSAGVAASVGVAAVVGVWWGKRSVRLDQ
jgi:hypothetical protein